MRMLNDAFENAAAFKDLMRKTTQFRQITAAVTTSDDVAAWNAEVDRKKAEKLARKVANCERK